MDNLSEFMQLCRLCLVKDQVNVPIFEEQGDIRQIFLKITACLPIKVSKDDSLPKKICDGCLYKLELLYQFWNTTANAEKQLLAWLSQAGMEADSKTTQEAVAIALQTQVTTHSVKEEEIDPPESIPESTDDMTTEAESFIMQPPQLPFEPAGAQFDEPSGFNESQGESHDDDDNGAQNDDDSEDEETEPPPRKRSRRQAAIKAAQLVAQKDDDDDDEDEEEDVDDPDDPTVEEPTIPKTEEESEEEMEESGTNPEPTDFVSLGTADEEQPGPSGVGKVDNSEAPNYEADHIPSKLSPFKSQNPRTSKAKQHRGRRKYECNLREYKGNTNRTKTQMPLNHRHKPFKCTICDRQFIHMRSLGEHVWLHSVNRPFKCDFCDYQAVNKSRLKVHMWVHSYEKPFKCDLCDYQCSQKADMKKHTLVHTGEKPFKCVICDYQSSQSGDLKKHVLIHSNKKLFKCDRCDYQCTRNTDLKVHDWAHRDEKPFKCDLCDYQCAQSSSLKSHMMVHSGEKPFKCEVCDYQCSQRGNLKRHILIHNAEKLFNCDLCDYQFVQSSYLEDHMLVHSDENPK